MLIITNVIRSSKVSNVNVELKLYVYYQQQVICCDPLNANVLDFYIGVDKYVL